MKFFSGFCVNVDKNFFNEFIEDREFVVAGFSYGAQKAVEYALNSSTRVDKIQLLSPAFFDYPQKLIDLNINAFRKNKNLYIKNFLTKAGIDEWRNENGKWEIVSKEVKVSDCNEEDLIKLFNFDWEKVKELKDVKIEVFLGEFDKILALKKAYEFFKDVGVVYLIKGANHFLRSRIGKK